MRSHEIINEIEVTQESTIGPLDPVYAAQLIDSPIIGNLNGKDVRRLDTEHGGSPLFCYGIVVDNEIASYFIVGRNSDLDCWMALRAWTNPNFRRQGLSILLFEFAILHDDKKPMISDFLMSFETVARIQKMIGQGKVKFKILDTLTRQILRLDPELPIYTLNIPGYPNVAEHANRFRYVWLMEQVISGLGMVERTGILQEHTTFLDGKPRLKVNEMDTSDVGYYQPEDDKVRTAKLGQTRRPILTLKRLNRLKKIRATRKLEQIKRAELLQIMYGQPEAEEFL